MSKPTNGTAHKTIIGILLAAVLFLLGLVVTPDQSRAKVQEHETRIALLEQTVTTMAENIKEIKSDVKGLVKEKP